jgi:aspartyl/asparaginyl beta-hydroxylase (cupin superfamily)
MSKLWFSLFDLSLVYKGPEPAFIDNYDFEWAREFQENHDNIKNELKAYLTDSDLTSYFNSSMVNNTNAWRTISLKNWEVVLFKNHKFFEHTAKIINKYPEILSLSFNLLEPGGKILPHCGDTNGIYRCHYGIEIPSAMPNCGFRVLDETRPWKEREWLIFMDAYNHEAYNKTESSRIIMVVDVLRDEYKGKRNKIVSTVRTSLFLQKRAQTLKFILKLPNFVIYTVAFLLRPFALLATKVVNYFKIY